MFKKTKGMILMRHFSVKNVKESIAVGLDTGEDVLKSIKKVIKEEKIKNGVIVSGAGSLSKARYHIVEKGDTKAWKDKFIVKEGRIEIMSLSGVIANGKPHVHITMSMDDAGFGGHLEEGSIILTLAEIVILRLEGKMERRDSGKGYGSLFIKD